jgi:hypothetical protein
MISIFDYASEFAIIMPSQQGFAKNKKPPVWKGIFLTIYLMSIKLHR